jgi:hypothetical protein
MKPTKQQKAQNRFERAKYIATKHWWPGLHCIWSIKAEVNESMNRFADILCDEDFEISDDD